MYRGGYTMNRKSLEGKWNQLKGDAKHKWAMLSDDDLSEVEGDADKLAGVLQEKYGYEKERARNEVNAWIESL
jgi:uncharacterized protein YjbJ (UPF0337 family)